jgi:hypothetical protein
MVLAVFLLILAGVTTLATIVSMALEKVPGKRALTLVFSVAYVVVMVLSALALMNG